MGGNGPVIEAGLGAGAAAFGLAAAFRAGVLRAAGAALFVTFLVWRAMERFSQFAFPEHRINARRAIARA
jgi:hypothetical protein